MIVGFNANSIVGESMSNILELRKILELTAIEKALKDKTYESLLRANPKAALEELGIAIPDNIKIELVEETPGTITIIYPKAPSEELSELSLAAVAGGSISFHFNKSNEDGSSVDRIPPI